MLVDGLQGDDNYRSGRYIGLYGQNFDAIIDLQETKEISSVSLGTYLVPGDYIFGLTGLEIYGSNDGSAYSKIASKTIPVLEKGSKNNVLKRDTVSFGTVSYTHLHAMYALSEKTLRYFRNGIRVQVNELIYSLMRLLSTKFNRRSPE